jgi:DNA mismatch repair protein MutS
MSATPMMQQYLDAKSVCGDALLLFRMGDFYELFHDDAKLAARVLGLTLTSREKGENAIPMAGFPYHQLESYLGKLIAAGHRAAVCDQVEDPKLAKGLVKREVTRVVTPGTLTDDALLDPRESNYLAAVTIESNGSTKAPPRAGLAWAELSTGRFFATVCPPERLAEHLARIQPSECLLSESAPPLPPQVEDSVLLTRRPNWAFSYDGARDGLAKHFGSKGLEGFGFNESDSPAVRAAGAVLDYLRETQKASLDHIDRLTPYRAGETLEIDEATRRSLELTRTIRDGRREGSLLAAIDRAVTPMGSRLLGEWLANPLTVIDRIHERLDAVEELRGDPVLCSRPRSPAARAGCFRNWKRTWTSFPICGRSSTPRSWKNVPSLRATAASSRTATRRSLTRCGSWPRGARNGSPATRRKKRRTPASRASRSATTRSSAITWRSPTRIRRRSQTATSASRRSRTPSATSRRS